MLGALWTCARRRLASGSRRPQAGLRLRGQSPQPPPRGPPSPALRPPLGRRPERGRPLRPPRRGPERGREAGKGSAAGGGPWPPDTRAGSAGGQGRRGSGSVCRRSARSAPALARWQGRRGRGRRGRATGAAPTPAAFFLRLLLFCWLHVAQVSKS